MSDNNEKAIQKIAEGLVAFEYGDVGGKTFFLVGVSHSLLDRGHPILNKLGDKLFEQACRLDINNLYRLTRAQEVQKVSTALNAIIDTYNSSNTTPEAQDLATEATIKLIQHNCGISNRDKAFELVNAYNEKHEDNLTFRDQTLYLGTDASLKKAKELLTKELTKPKNSLQTDNPFESTVKNLISELKNYKYSDKTSAVLLDVLKHAHNLNPDFVTKELHSATNLTKKEDKADLEALQNAKDRLGIVEKKRVLFF